MTLSATLTAPSGPVNEGHVTFAVAGQTATTSVSGGAASVMIALPAGLAPGSYAIGASYTDGNPDPGNFRPGSGMGTLTVNPLPPPAVIGPPPSVSVAFSPFGEVIELVTSTGQLVQFDAFGAHALGGGARAASVAFTPFGEVLLVTYQTGALVQYDAAGAHVLAAAGVQDASVAFGPFGEVIDVVTPSGVLTQFDAFGAHTLGGGVAVISVAFDASGSEVQVVTTQSGALVQFDATGAHVLFAGVRSAGVAFAPFGEIMDVIFQDGSLWQFGAGGAIRLGMVA